MTVRKIEAFGPMGNPLASMSGNALMSTSVIAARVEAR
jgi:hypothetical protein